MLEQNIIELGLTYHLVITVASEPEESWSFISKISRICSTKRCSLIALQNSSNSLPLSSADFPFDSACGFHSLPSLVTVLRHVLCFLPSASLSSSYFHRKVHELETSFHGPLQFNNVKPGQC